MPVPKHRPRIVVVGDLIVDVVLAPAAELITGTDVLGRVMLRQGGSATTTARWLGRSGAGVSLVASVGRDSAGRALVRTIRDDGVTPRVVRIAGHATGRVGVFVAPGGERSFVQDRGAALWLAPEHLRASWFVAAELVHIPTYSLLDHPLGDAGRRAAELAHAAGALVTVDLSSSGPLLALGRAAAIEVVHGAQPDLLFAAGSEAGALADDEESLLDVAPIVVLKRGPHGASLLYRDGGATCRLEVAARAVEAPDTTGAGDAFAAGFILGWLAARHDGSAAGVALRRGAEAGNRLAARHLVRPRRELAFD
jgi:sugar/nucleoside kinase (ribokinase family)